MLIAISIFLFFVLVTSMYYEVFYFNNYYFPFFTFVGLYYFFFHAVIPFYGAFNVYHFPYSGNIGIEAVLFTIAFVGFQFAGYFLSLRFIHFRQSLVPNGSTAALKLVSWTLMAGFFVIHFVLKYRFVPSLPQLMMPCWYFSFSVLVFMLFQGQLTRPQIAILILGIASKLLIDVAGGLLTPILFSTAIVLSIALWRKHYRILIVILLVGASLPMSYGYIKYLSRVHLNGGVADIYMFSPDLSLNSLISSINAMARRSSHLLLTGHVFENTPNPVPFDDRNPFVDTAINHVPRIFWSSKPKEIFGNKFGRRYEIVDKNDTKTSWNLPWVVDFFITFGPIFSIVYVFCVGGVLGVCVKWMSSRPDQPFWYGVYSATIFPLFYQESNFSLMTGSVVSVLIFLLITYWFADRVLRWRG